MWMIWLNRIDYFLALVSESPGHVLLLAAGSALFCRLSWDLYKKQMTAVRRRRWAFQQKDMTALRRLSWQEFEILVGEVFRKRGYQVTLTGGGGADGGIDMILHRKGRKYLVQCKHYKKSSVGASVVREIVGLGVREEADGVYVVTVGKFTKAAKAFAIGLPVRLVDGQKCLSLINQKRMEK